MEENLALVVSDPEIALNIGKGPTSQAEDQQIGKRGEAAAPIDVDQALVIVVKVIVKAVLVKSVIVVSEDVPERPIGADTGHVVRSDLVVEATLDDADAAGIA